MTRLQKQITACAVLHILFSFFLLAVSGVMKGEVITIIPLAIAAIAFPVIFTFALIHFMNQKGWFVNSQTAGERRPKSYYFVISILTFLNMLFLLVFQFLISDITGSSEIFFNPLSTVLYISTLISGILMFIDTKNDKAVPLLLFLKSAALPVTFLLAVISAIPLMYTVMPVIFYMFGFLIYVPLILFIMQICRIRAYCRRIKMNMIAISALIIGLLVLPAIGFTQSCLDRINFGNAIVYLDENNASGGDEMSKVNIPRLVSTFKNYNTIEGIGIPFVTKGYESFIFKGGQLTDSAKTGLSLIFNYDFCYLNDDTDVFSSDFTLSQNPEDIRNKNIVLENLTSKTEYDDESGAYKTWIDLEIKNTSYMSNQEYVTNFVLPNGCFIKDYYLYVGEEKKEGILADKRAAVSIYQREVSQRIDPGIIYYESDGTVTLKVYPFNNLEIRKTGFLVMHHENFTLSVDEKSIEISLENALRTPLDMQGVSYIPASFKPSLKALERTPKYIFLADAKKKSLYSEQLRKIEDYIAKYGITNYKIFDVNYKVEEYTGNRVKTQGGFNLPLAMDRALKEVKEGEYPIMIAATDNITNALQFDRSEIAGQYPESTYFYKLEYDLSLKPYSFIGNTAGGTVKEPIITKALDYNGSAVKDDHVSQTVVTGEIGGFVKNDFQNAIVLFAKTSQHMKDAGNQADLVRDSFRQKVLTPFTAFSAWETEQQERDLYRLNENMMQDPGNYNGGARFAASRIVPAGIMEARKSMSQGYSYGIRDSLRSEINIAGILTSGSSGCWIFDDWVGVNLLFASIVGLFVGIVLLIQLRKRQKNLPKE